MKSYRTGGLIGRPLSSALLLTVCSFSGKILASSQAPPSFLLLPVLQVMESWAGPGKDTIKS